MLEPATSKRPVLLAKRSHHHVAPPVEEDDDDEAVPPDEVPKTRGASGRGAGSWRTSAWRLPPCLYARVASRRPSSSYRRRMWHHPTCPSSRGGGDSRGVKVGRSGLLVAGAAARPVLRPVATFSTRRPVLRKIGGFVARAGISNTVTRGLRKVRRRAIPVLKRAAC